MKLRIPARAAMLLTAAVLALTVSLSAAPAPVSTTGVVKDRESFIPHRKYHALPGKVVGVLVSDVAPKMAHEGRGGPPDAMGFSMNSGSYRWIYVPVAQGNAIIQNLQVAIGEKGQNRKIYPFLNMANAKTVQQWGIQVPYALVEVEVNDGEGAPADEAFVATKMTRLDGTKEMPFNVTETVAELRKKYETWKKDEKNKLDAAMTEAQTKAIKDRKPTGPRETQELMYMTWLPESKRLRVHFRTTVTDGDYKFAGGGIERRPFELPPPPPVPPAPPGALPAPGFAALPPPPLEFPRVRFGTSFGIEYGIAYEVSTSGRIERIETLPPLAQVNELPPPPVGGIDRIRPIDRLPPRPIRN